MHRSPLKVSFAGGRWPSVRTGAVPEDWSPWKSLTAEVTVGRSCLVGFQAVQEKSLRDDGWDGCISRWARTFFLKPGKNELRASLEDPSANGYGLNPKKYGRVVSFEIFFYAPHPGETLEVRDVKLLREKTASAPSAVKFKVAGSGLEVPNVRDLGKMLKEKWTKPEPRTVDQVEAEFKAGYEKLKAEHPRALLASFREGENGYTGWRDAHINSHGPDTNTRDRSRNRGTSETEEAFMRHRSLLMRADLSSIPTGSTILAAKLILVAADTQFEKGRDPRVDANLWAVEPCNRPWVENEVNAYEYAKDKFWKSVGGTSYGDDPDFHPVYLAFGPGNAPVSSWDFTEALKFWTEGRHENHGFMLHGDSFHYMGRAYCRESREIRNRPAILVVYEPR
ncbi:MAG: DNRLRE domain-containing protein [Planctomycetes bacterium]|nr:DNRLRE domain-containing protein [Planctomycetota bacterium]